MGVEQGQNYQSNYDKYKDFRDALSDSQLTEKYYKDCEAIIQETQENCSLLQKEVALEKDKKLYEEMTTMSREEVRNLQNIVGLEGKGVDGLRGPGTFALYMDFIEKNLSLSQFGPKELQNHIVSLLETTFEGLSQDEKKSVQSSVGAKTDGIFGPNTQRKIIENFEKVADIFLAGNSGEPKEEVVAEMNIEAVTEDVITTEPAISVKTLGEGDFIGPRVNTEETAQIEMKSPEEVPEVETPKEEIQEEIVKRNILGMTREEFNVAKENIRNTPEYKEAREIARNFNRKQIENIQGESGAIIDGSFGPGTYLFFTESKLHKAGFSLEEMADMKKVVSQGDLEELLSQISSSYNISPEVIDEIFGELSVGDYISYDVLWGEISHFDIETGEKGSISVTNGIYDSISIALEKNEYQSLIDILDRLKNPAQRGMYINILTEYIKENELFTEARSIFSQKSEEGGRDLYTINFHGNIDLGNNITANDLFNDQDYLIVQNVAYIRQGDDYKSTDGNETRLSLKNGTKVEIPSPQDKELIDTAVNELLQKAEIQKKIEDNLGQTVKAGDIDSILLYCRLFSDAKKKVLLYNIEQLALKDHQFLDLRRMFTTQNEAGEYTIKTYKDSIGVGSLFENGLTAFELFGDYKTISSSGDDYHSITETDYTGGGKRLAIKEGSIVSIVDTSFRTQAEYKRIGEYPQLAKDLGKWIERNYVNNGNNSCGASVGDALIKFGIKGLPTGGRHGYNWKGFLDARPDQFMKVAISHPSEAKPGGIITFGANARGGTSMRKKYGHVEMVGANKQYYSYYHSNTPGGSASSNAKGEQYKKDTGFEGFVYYPKSKA